MGTRDLIDDAIYALVHGHKGGAVDLAAKAGGNAGTINNKADPGMPGHQPTLRETITWQLLRQDFGVLNAYAATLNHIVLPVVDFSGIADTALLESWANAQAEEGKLASIIRDALEDNRITSGELRDIKGQLFITFQARMELYRRLESLRDDSAKDGEE